MSEMHTNTTTDTDKYILNGVEVTPNEFIDIVTNLLEAQHSRLRRREARIAELEATVEIHADISNAYEKRISEIVSLSNNANAKLQSRIAELGAVIDQLIEVGEKMFTAVIAAADSYDEGMREWDKIVNDWKEG